MDSISTVLTIIKALTTSYEGISSIVVIAMAGAFIITSFIGAYTKLRNVKYGSFKDVSEENRALRAEIRGVHNECSKTRRELENRIREIQIESDLCQSRLAALEDRLRDGLVEK